MFHDPATPYGHLAWDSVPRVHHEFYRKNCESPEIDDSWFFHQTLFSASYVRVALRLARGVVGVCLRSNAPNRTLSMLFTISHPSAETNKWIGTTP